MTSFPFQPTQTQNVSFQTTFDGELYTVQTFWNLFGKRWYFSVTDLSGNPVIAAMPLVASPQPWQLSGLAWQNGIAAGTIDGILTLRPGAVINLTIFGCLPVGLNYAGPCKVIDGETFSFPIASNPNPFAPLPQCECTLLGQAGYLTNLLAGFFKTSTLVYYQDSQQIVVRP